MHLQNTLNEFFFNMVVGELKQMNNMPSSANITYNSLLYLDIISFKKKCTVSFIAESLRISKSAVTIKVNDLIKQGLVYKTQCLEDKRIHYLSLTKKVADEYKLYDINLSNIIEEIKNTYSLEDVSKFCDMLHFISNHYSQGDNNEKSTI